MHHVRFHVQQQQKSNTYTQRDWFQFNERVEPFVGVVRYSRFQRNF